MEITLQTMVLLSNIFASVPLFRILCMDKTTFYKGVSTDEKHVESHSLEFVRSSSLKCSDH